MSVEALTWALNTRCPSSGSKLVLIVLANSASESGVTWIGRERVAAASDLTPRSVSENLAKLTDEGLIARIRRFRKNGSRTSDWTILGPLHLTRSPMVNLHPSDYTNDLPSEVARLARKWEEGTSPSRDAGRPSEDFDPHQVKISGGPETLEEPSGLTEGSSARSNLNLHASTERSSEGSAREANR